ncbi:hypothetical protein PanWU01x14_265350 [Parasponia andersonii]|uniref:Uncharacterized protein n=1 Tax=Parasponia andersonii TaxID=3476 RepID=A0A2P5B7B1_PARAD|nr:hypothetical protein PanWU01x14_265350 [Parasponia andersonii]
MTGAKLSERTCLGSTEGRSGGSMKLLMMSSKAVKSAPGSVGGLCLRGRTSDEDEEEEDDDDDELGLRGGEVGVVLTVVGPVVVVVEEEEGLSSILTEEMRL